MELRADSKLDLTTKWGLWVPNSGKEKLKMSLAERPNWDVFVVY